MVGLRETGTASAVFVSLLIGLAAYKVVCMLRVVNNGDNHCLLIAVSIITCSLGEVVNAALYASYRRRGIKTHLISEFGSEPCDAEVHEG